jgi:hypothetical protein
MCDATQYSALALARASEEIRHQLQARPHVSRTHDGDHEEIELEKLYVQHAAHALLQRREVFGQDYVAHADMPKHHGQRAARGVYEALKAMAVSAARSPVSLAVAAWWSGEDFPVASDVDLAAGVSGGGTSYLMNKIMVDGVTRTVNKFNLPIVSELSDEQLKQVFGSPNPVELKVKDGVKHYQKLTEIEITVRRNHIQHNIDVVKRMRASFKGQGFGSMHIQGVFSGAYHTLRHQLSAAKGLGNWSFVLGTAAIASGGDGLSTSPIVSAMQSHQIKLDNLVGGQQRVSLFPVQRRRPDVRLPKAQDLPRMVAHSIREMGALAGQFGYNLTRPATAWYQVLDVVMHMTCNSIARRAAREFGQAMGAAFRNGGELPYVGENLHSLANGASRFTAYWGGDTVWKAFKQASEASAGFDLGKSLDHRRDAKMAAWEQQAKQNMGQAWEALNLLKLDDERLDDFLPPNVANMLEEVLTRLDHTHVDIPNVLKQVRQCVTALVNNQKEAAQLERCQPKHDAVQALLIQRFRTVAHQLNKVKKAQANRDHLQSWRQGPLVEEHQLQQNYPPKTPRDDELNAILIAAEQVSSNPLVTLATQTRPRIKRKNRDDTVLDLELEEAEAVLRQHGE